MIGKLPPELLQKYVLNFKGAKQDALLTGPGVGEDAAVIKVSDDRYFLVSSDPIVGATENIGKFLIEINVNDIAAKGGDPKFLILTLIIPEKFGEHFIFEIMQEIDLYAKKYGIAIAGGHTEISPFYEKPIISATIIGETTKIYDLDKIKKGDKVLLIGDAAIEGTAIIYNEKKDMLNPILDEEERKEVSDYINRLSIYEYSKKVREYALFMHDPTEGGILGGLSEIDALFFDKGIKFYDNIKFRKVVLKITDFFNISPKRLISSGALLSVFDDKILPFVKKELEKEDIPYQIIGEIADESNYEKSFDEELWKVIS